MHDKTITDPSNACRSTIRAQHDRIHATKNKRRGLIVVLTVATTVFLSACATDDPNRRAKVGAGIGAVIGAVVGDKVGGGNGKFLGAAIGALAGGAVGNYQDNQQRALEASLAEEKRLQQVSIERLQNDVLRVSLSDAASFDIGSAEVKPAFEPTLVKIANQTASYDKTVLHIVGFTDDTGSEEFNQELSNRRAASVARILEYDGVRPERLQIEGRGESQPRVPNTSASNRAKNRRVEIYIQPIVEGQEENALQAPQSTYF